MNLSNKKATEMRSNQRVKLVDPNIDDEKEIKRDNLKLKVMDTYKEYISKYCNKDGEIKGVMSQDVKLGMKSLKEKSKSKKINIVPTDKTNKTTVMLPETYQKSMEEHYKEDKVINKKEENKVQRTLDDHSKSAV